MSPDPDAELQSVFESLEARGSARCRLWSDPASGLRAILVIDDLTLGPAAGGVRTRVYPSLGAAAEDCAKLARAMTIKCALAGLDAGGAKLVVMDQPELDRPRAFARLGQLVDELDGQFRTAGDLGTTKRDLEAMATNCRFVHTDESGLADAVAGALLRCIEACASTRGVAVASLCVAVQGVGVIGEAVARRLAAAGARILLADLDRDRALRVASELGAERADPLALLTANTDILAPCAVGGVIGGEEARTLRAWAVCGAANNILADDSAAKILSDRGVLFVPDPVASAGAVIEGVGRSVMGLEDPGPLIDALGVTALEILRESATSGEPTPVVAERRARIRIERSVHRVGALRTTRSGKWT